MTLQILSIIPACKYLFRRCVKARKTNLAIFGFQQGTCLLVYCCCLFLLDMTTAAQFVKSARHHQLFLCVTVTKCTSVPCSQNMYQLCMQYFCSKSAMLATYPEPVCILTSILSLSYIMASFSSLSLFPSVCSPSIFSTLLHR